MINVLNDNSSAAKQHFPVDFLPRPLAGTAVRDIKLPFVFRMDL